MSCCSRFSHMMRISRAVATLENDAEKAMWRKVTRQNINFPLAGIFKLFK